jgi:transposase
MTVEHAYIMGMYLRTTQRKNRDGSVVRYYQLAHNVRDPQSGQVTAKVLYNFGRADELEREELLRLCRSIARVCGVEVHEALGAGTAELETAALPPDIEVLRTVELGTLLLAEALWKRLGLDSLLEELCRKSRRSAPLDRAVFVMVANRLCEPHSKLGVWERWLPKVYLPWCWELELRHFYEAMDLLLEHIAQVEEMVFFRTANLFNLEVDLIFYDTTCAEFTVDYEDEEEGQEEPALRRWGRNKDGGSSVQVIVALAVTRDGLPVRSWVFPGNTADCTTIGRVRADLREWKLARCLFIGDAGMNSEENRAELSRAGGKYIVAVRADSTEVRDEVLTRPGRYKVVSDSLQVKEVVVGEGEKRSRYILCYNPKEAERQKKRREAVIAELRSLFEQHRSCNVRAKWTADVRASKRTGRYVSVGQDGSLYIDAEKVQAAERLDGKWILLTNDDSLSVEDIATSYRAMEVIERCFRSLKTAQIQLAPMFHRLGRRIEAHVKLCVLALLLQRIAELECKRPWMRLHDSLRQLQATEFRSGDHQFFRRNQVSKDVAQIFKTLKIQQPDSLLTLR